MVKHKYGEYPDEQVSAYLRKLHSLVHWLLIYKDNNDPSLINYFSSVQFKINGLNELFNYPVEIVEIMELIESARLEYLKDDCDGKKYKGAILDAHALIDKIVKGGD